MNERIKELALQAGFAYEPIKDQLWVGGPIEIMISPGLEKFAELIVQECIGVLNKRYMGDNNREDFEVRRCVEDLKKHFGVK
jgi:hypothetical protein